MTDARYKQILRKKPAVMQLKGILQGPPTLETTGSRKGSRSARLANQENGRQGAIKGKKEGGRPITDETSPSSARGGAANTVTSQIKAEYGGAPKVSKKKKQKKAPSSSPEETATRGRKERLNLRSAGSPRGEDGKSSRHELARHNGKAEQKGAGKDLGAYYPSLKDSGRRTDFQWRSPAPTGSTAKTRTTKDGDDSIRIEHSSESRGRLSNQCTCEIDSVGGNDASARA